MRITTKDIAEASGVSLGTVDRALNDRPGINEKTKEKVLQVAKDLGYRPNFLARSLVKGETKTLGLVFFNLKNRFFAQLVDTIEIKARQLGYFVYLTLTDTDPDIEKDCINHLVDRKVDGIIICPVNKGKKYEDFLMNLKIPVVTVTNKISNNFTFLGIRDRQAMKEVVNYTLRQNYKEIIYISPPLIHRDKTNIYGPEQRYLGFLEVLKDQGDKVKALVIDHKDIFSELDKVDFKIGPKKAIICTSDVYALRVLNYLKARKVRVPNEVGLVGFDNIDVLEYVEPKLATVSYPLEEIGKKAVESVVSKIKGTENDNSLTEDILLGYKFLPGESI